MNELFLGIDTSNYKTSIAVVDSTNRIIFNRSEYLDVKQGEKGLRQSEAFFLHSNKLPEYFDDLCSNVDSRGITSIGVSTRPRRIEGSYMPCFLAGYNLARELGSALNIPVYEYSHQEGHAAAAMSAYPELFSNKSLMFHLSGGTTEFLLCEPAEQGFRMEIVGGTKDISIGQLLDRIGVKMGMKFPSGMYLDDIAGTININKINKEIFSEVKQLVTRPKPDNCYFNLSGLETKLIRYLESEHDPDITNTMVKYLFIVIADLLSDMAIELSARYNINDVLMAGGVASSQNVRTLIKEKNRACNIYFCEPELSGDNAVGVAILARNTYSG